MTLRSIAKRGHGGGKKEEDDEAEVEVDNR